MNIMTESKLNGKSNKKVKNDNQISKSKSKKKENLYKCFHFQSCKLCPKEAECLDEIEKRR